MRHGTHRTWQRWEEAHLPGQKHILLSGKGHFHIQLIELAGRAVPRASSSRKQGGYLEIAVKSGGHQQLLKLLGRLGQCVKSPGCFREGTR